MIQAYKPMDNGPKVAMFARILHWKAVKRILQYIQGTINYGIHYASDSPWIS
jgi:hypothetical protein